MRFAQGALHQSVAESKHVVRWRSTTANELPSAVRCSGASQTHLDELQVDDSPQPAGQSGPGPLDRSSARELVLTDRKVAFGP